MRRSFETGDLSSLALYEAKNDPSYLACLKGRSPSARYRFTLNKFGGAKVGRRRGALEQGVGGPAGPDGLSGEAPSPPPAPPTSPWVSHPPSSDDGAGPSRGGAMPRRRLSDLPADPQDPRGGAIGYPVEGVVDRNSVQADVLANSATLQVRRVGRGGLGVV